MLLETLGRLRSKPPVTPERSQESVLDGDEASRQSFRSSNTVTSSSPPSSLTSSPSGRSAKRYSNNLFGSGRFRDYTYMRSVAQSKQGSSRVNSFTPTESSVSLRGNTSSMTDSLRPVTPESGGDPSSSVQSSPNEKLAVRSAPLIPPAPYGGQAMSAAEYRLSKTLGPSVMKRASLALEGAIKELEEDIEDEIVMPRSPPIPRGSFDQARHSPERVRCSILTSGQSPTPC